MFETTEIPCFVYTFVSSLTRVNLDTKLVSNKQMAILVWYPCGEAI